MTLIGALRDRRYAPRIRERTAAYAECCSPADRGPLQLEFLNREWERIAREVPYYARKREEQALPERFASLEEFAERVPITTRDDVQAHATEMQSAGRQPNVLRMTGGSTAKPVRIPAWRSEFETQRWDMWNARAWYGLRPASRLFLIWGHSHLLGTGMRGWLNARRLELSDRLLGYHRFSAYDLRLAMMRRAAEELLRFRPAYVLGYSVALDLFAAANRDRRKQLRTSGVRLVVGTAEAFPTPESADRLRDLFGCDVAMEYGAVETGLLAHTHPEGGYRAFWRSYLLEVAGGEHTGRLLVTSLYPRCLPLVRYEIGDEIELDEAQQDSGSGISAFERVIGRCNDYVLLADGTTVHSEVFSHVVRPCTSVRGFQVIQSSEHLRLRFTSAGELLEAEKLALRERLKKVHPDLQRLSFERVDHLEQTVAGKTRMVIRKP